MSEGTMADKAIEEAAALLIRARRTGERLTELPAACRPRTVEAAHAIQDAVTAGLGARAGGWKVNAPPDAELQRGVLFESLIFASPARIPARQVPLLGIEAEIAFRLSRDLPARDTPYARDEIADALVAFAAIEVVDSRFRDHDKVTALERLADDIINGAFVYGAPCENWRALDLKRLPVRQTVDGQVTVEKVGGHPTGDPLQPAEALINHMRTRGGMKAGLRITTGSCTGLTFAQPGQTVTATFEGLGTVEVTFTR
jgi:2-keto-4-pentenoate hydratase